MMVFRFLFGAMLASFTSASTHAVSTPIASRASFGLPSQNNPFVGLHLASVTSLRGGDIADGTAQLSSPSKDLLSADNLAAFFGINGLLLGIGFTLAPDVTMALLHNYKETGTPANKASTLAGANMLAYGLISYLSVTKNVSATKSMGWSLAPLIAHLFVRGVVGSENSASYQTAAAVVASIIAVCAASLISGQGLPIDVAAGAVIVILGSIDILSILFPDEMMQKLEYTSDFQPMDYKLRFVTQAIGVHSLAHLSLFFALWQGQDPITAVGISSTVIAILGAIVCVILPNMRKSGAPLAPMVPFIGLFSYMSWKMLGSK